MIMKGLEGWKTKWSLLHIFPGRLKIMTGLHSKLVCLWREVESYDQWETGLLVSPFFFFFELRMYYVFVIKQWFCLSCRSVYACPKLSKYL